MYCLVVLISRPSVTDYLLTECPYILDKATIELHSTVSSIIALLLESWRIFAFHIDVKDNGERIGVINLKVPLIIPGHEER